MPRTTHHFAAARRIRWEWVGLLALTSLVLGYTLARALDRLASARVPPPSALPTASPLATALDAPAPEFDPAAAAGASALLTYRARAAALRKHALESGTLCYLQVTRAAYGHGVITPRVLAIKAHYRRKLAQPHRTITDYDHLLRTSRVAMGRRVHDPLMATFIGGMYDSSCGLLILTPTSRDTVLFHEAAHAIQNPVGPFTENMGDPRTYRALQCGRLRDDQERMLRYLTSSPELEIALQDLNRFHAVTVAGRPLFTPEETVTAIARLGVSITAADVVAAFALEKRVLTEARAAELIRAGRPVGRESQLFADARKLQTVHELAARVGSEYWATILNRVVFEAPGHF